VDSDVNGVLLIGASGLAREVLAAGIEGAVGILDDDESRHGQIIGGVPVLGAVASAAARAEDLLITIGPSGARRKVVAMLAALGVADERFATFVSTGVRLGATSVVGRGSVILDGTVITADAAIGRHVVVMPNCTITHDDVIADFATLAAGVSLGGTVRVGEAAYIGMNASVRQQLSIGPNATVGMGSVVLGDVPASQTWAGVPARELGVQA
jgi:sugar O-acyltransferase (sialic acid O-acetyltransferase NeuD family)